MYDRDIDTYYYSDKYYELSKGLFRIKICKNLKNISGNYFSVIRIFIM